MTTTITKQINPLESIELGIALSGGSARGIAHIGVLKALEEYQLAPNVIAGTSMGAIVGVLYASGISPDEIAEILKSEKLYNIFGINIFKRGLLNLEPLMELFEKKIGTDDFSVLKKPFYVSVANLNTGRGEIVSHGKNLFRYVIASASLPFIFPPQHINDNTYIDGGLFNNLPAEPLVGRVDRIIGVHVNPNGFEKNLKGARAIAERSFRLAIAQNVKLSRNYCDYYIEPRNIRLFSSWDYKKVDDLIEMGYQATLKSIHQFILPDLADIKG
ncbi:patatin [Marinilabiliaceae bacterium JC017]|nr:patatin [Marinilabiliaceae bacterium JC017]